MKSLGLYCGILLWWTAFACFGQTNTLDFESLAAPGTSFVNLGKFYREKGFVLSLGKDSFGYFACFRTNDSHFAGSVGLFNNIQEGYCSLARDDGGIFDLISINLCGLQQSSGTFTVTFTGYNGLQAGSNYQVNVSGNFEFQTFQFSRLTNLTEVRWQQPQVCQFDRVVVRSLTTPAAPPKITMSKLPMPFAIFPLELTHLRVESNYVILKSTNLVNWQTFRSLKAYTTSTAEYDFYTPTSVPQVFYQLQYAP